LLYARTEWERNILPQNIMSPHEAKERDAMEKPCTRRPRVDEGVIPSPEPLCTTLYDLIAALQDSADLPEEMEVVTAAAIHVLNTHRVTCTGRLKGYRMVVEDGPTSSRIRAGSSQPEKTAVSF
jgi:hypothetical protein